MRRDLALNALGSALKVFVIGWLIRVAGQQMSVAAFGLFLLARRLADTGATLLQAGTAATLMRFLPIHAREPGARRYLLLVALGWSVITTVGVGVICVTLGPKLGRWMFPDAAEQGKLLVYTAALTIAGILTFQALATTLGQRHIVRANLIGLLAGGGFGLMYLLVTGQQESPLPALGVQAAGSAVASLAFLGFYLKGAWSSVPLSGKRPLDFREMFIEYGLPRTIVGFMDAGLLLLGPWLIRDRVDLAGYLLAALVIFRVAQAAIQPVAQLAFVVTAEFVGQSHSAGISSGVRLIVGAVLHLGTVGLAFLVPWAGFLVVLWLGPGPVSRGVMQLYIPLLFGLLPYTLFRGLKGVVEADSVRPLNLISLGASAAGLVLVFFAVSRVRSQEDAVVAALNVAFVLAGGLSLVWLRDRLPAIRYLGLAHLLVLVLVVFSTNWWLAQNATAPRLAIGLLLTAMATAFMVGYGRSRFLNDCRSFLTGGAG